MARRRSRFLNSLIGQGVTVNGEADITAVSHVRIGCEACPNARNFDAPGGNAVLSLTIHHRLPITISSSIRVAGTGDITGFGLSCDPVGTVEINTSPCGTDMCPNVDAIKSAANMISTIPEVVAAVVEEPLLHIRRDGTVE